MAAPANRNSRRALKRAGVEVMHTVTIDGAAVAKAVVMGVDVVDLIMHNVDTALRALEAEGGDILTHAVVTIGRHPDHPEDLTVQAKTASRKVMVASTEVVEVETGTGDDVAAIKRALDDTTD